jgi:hypothetical protein
MIKKAEGAETAGAVSDQWRRCNKTDVIGVATVEVIISEYGPWDAEHLRAWRMDTPAPMISMAWTRTAVRVSC